MLYHFEKFYLTRFLLIIMANSIMKFLRYRTSPETLNYTVLLIVLDKPYTDLYNALPTDERFRPSGALVSTSGSPPLLLPDLVDFWRGPLDIISQNGWPLEL